MSKLSDVLKQDLSARVQLNGKTSSYLSLTEVGEDYLVLTNSQTKTKTQIPLSEISRVDVVPKDKGKVALSMYTKSGTP